MGEPLGVTDHSSVTLFAPHSFLVRSAVTSRSSFTPPMYAVSSAGKGDRPSRAPLGRAAATLEQQQTERPS